MIRDGLWNNWSSRREDKECSVRIVRIERCEMRARAVWGWWEVERDDSGPFRVPAFHKVQRGKGSLMQCRL